MKLVEKKHECEAQFGVIDVPEFSFWDPGIRFEEKIIFSV